MKFPSKRFKQLAMSFDTASGIALDRIGAMLYNVVRNPHETDAGYRMRIAMVAYQQKPVDGNDILKGML